MDTLDLAKKTVIVTGASSGIGEATARLLHKAGAHPVLAARRADRLEVLSGQLDGALAVETDLTDRDAVVALIAAAMDRHGRIDGLVNNAGTSMHALLDQMDLYSFARAFDINVLGMLAMIQAVLPVMRAQGGGRIVNISSGTTRVVPAGAGGYAATKAAVNMLTAVARKEFEGDNIAVSLVVPSLTATEFNGGRFTPGQEPMPGVVVHSPAYVGGVILRALRTGEECIDIPRGVERPTFTAVVS